MIPSNNKNNYVRYICIGSLKKQITSIRISNNYAYLYNRKNKVDCEHKTNLTCIYF